MCDKSLDVLSVLRKNQLINSKTIDSLISYGFDSNDSLNALDFDLDFPQMNDISSQQKSILKQILIEIKQNYKKSKEKQLNDRSISHLIMGEIKSIYSDINQRSLFGTIDKRMDLLKKRFDETEDLIDAKIDDQINRNRLLLEPELRQLSELLNGLRNELNGLNDLIQSIDNSNDNHLMDHKNNLFRFKNQLMAFSTQKSDSISDNSNKNSKSKATTVPKRRMSSNLKNKTKKSTDLRTSNEPKTKNSTQIVPKIKTQNELKCNFKNCGKRFKNISNLNQHLKSEHNLVKNQSFKCKYCHKLLLNKSGFQRHIDSHLGLKPFKCIHNYCDFSFVTNYELKRHLKTHFKKK